MAYPSLRVSTRATLTFIVALVVGAIALLSVGTRPAETQESSAQPLHYRVHDLGTIGGSSSVPLGINESNKVVGYSYTSGDWLYHAFLYDANAADPKMQDLGTLGGNFISAAYAINDSNKVVGESQISGDSAYHAFLYDANAADPKMQDLGTLGGAFSFAHGINDSNKVVGSSWTSAAGPEHAFLYDANAADPKMQDLGTLEGGAVSYAHGINDSNKVVGYSYIDAYGEFVHAFLYDANAADPKMQDLGTLGGSNSLAYAINDSNKVVGTSLISGNAVPHAFLSSDGVMHDLNSLIPANSGWDLREAKAINDDDYIVGTGVKVGQEGGLHAVLLTPDSTPQVASTDPKDGATGVARSTKVRATFSEQMDPTTLTGSTVQLFSGNSINPIKAPLTIGSKTNSKGQTVTTVTLTPSQKLDAKTRYKLLIRGGANSPVVRDLEGNALASDSITRFTTGSQ